jgi:cold shock CspA family protein
MGGSKESFNKKEVRNKKEKARKEKEKKRQARRENATKSSFEDMIAYVDENGRITSEAPDLTKKKESVKLEDIEIGIPKSDPNSNANKIKTGQVSFFNEAKGFGFIIESETKERIFVHSNELSEPVKEGNIVSFEIEKGVRGLSAVNVVMKK